jgi:hypothetical protein
MDPVFHFFISFFGGYVILTELYGKPKVKDILILSFLSVVIEVDHLLPVSVHVLHNIFTLLIVVAISLFLLRGRMRIYGCVLSVMLLGHLLFDMVEESEVALFFPFSRTAYVIPQSWGIMLTPTSYLVDRFGIAMTVYFIAVFLAILLIKKYDKNDLKKSG